MQDIVIIEGNNELNVEMVPIAAAQFIYVSSLRREPIGYDARWSVDVQNTGEAPGELTVVLYNRMQEPGGINWSAFMARDSDTHIVQPGQVVTFSGVVFIGPYTRQIMVKSEAGTLLNPLEPKEYICWYCLDYYQQIVSFETQEELDAHFASKHPGV